MRVMRGNGEGIEGGKRRIKRGRVEVGVVERGRVGDDLREVEMKGGVNWGMEKLVDKERVFWVVKGEIGGEGIRGVGRVVCGVYMEVEGGGKGRKMDK